MITNKNKDLKRLQALSFALVETGLYLDGHPDNQNALKYYDSINKEYSQMLENYESKHGAVTQQSNYATDNGKWQWTEGPWPWQN